MKNLILTLIKSKALQPLWEKIFHVSKIGMNYWGTEVHASGELKAIESVNRSLVNRESVVFDVGANKGQFIIYVSKIFSSSVQFFSFEPSGKTFEQLKYNVEKLGLPNLKIFNFGFGDLPGKQMLYMDAEGSTRASLYAEEKQVVSEEIELTTIDIFCEAEKINYIDYLKIDVEGHEIAVLKGAKDMLANKRIRFIQFEFGEGNISSRTFFKDFVTILQGYHFYRILPNGLRKIQTYSPELEVFSTCNYLAAAINEDF